MDKIILDKYQMKVVKNEYKVIKDKGVVGQKYSMENEIGSRREYSSLKKDSSKFNSDLFKIFSNCNNILKNNAHIIIIIGDGRVCGKTYDAKENIIQALHPLNWTLVNYSYSFLDQTSRSFQQSYRTKGKKEHVLIFQKGA